MFIFLDASDLFGAFYLNKICAKIYDRGAPVEQMRRKPLDLVKRSVCNSTAPREEKGPT